MINLTNIKEYKDNKELLKEINPLFIRYDKSRIDEESKQLNFDA